MINGGAVYTDESGNVPELSTLLHFVEDLTTRLNKNRGNLDDINALAKKVIGTQVSSIQQLETALRKHTSEDELLQETEEDDDDILELEQHEFEDSKEGDHELRRPRFARSSSVLSIPDRQTREIERRLKRSAPALASATPNTPEEDRQTPRPQEQQQQQQQSNTAATRHARIAQENLDLKVELQRLQSVESKLTDLVTQFQYKTGEVCDISKKYVRDYKSASRKLALSYEAQLNLERRNQQNLERARTQYLRRLDEVKTSLENAGAFIASDLQQKLDTVYGPDALVKYKSGPSLAPGSPSPCLK